MTVPVSWARFLPARLAFPAGQPVGEGGGSGFLPGYACEHRRVGGRRTWGAGLTCERIYCKVPLEISLGVRGNLSLTSSFLVLQS